MCTGAPLFGIWRVNACHIMYAVIPNKSRSAELYFIVTGESRGGGRGATPPKTPILSSTLPPPNRQDESCVMRLVRRKGEYKDTLKIQLGTKKCKNWRLRLGNTTSWLILSLRLCSSALNDRSMDCWPPGLRLNHTIKKNRPLSLKCEMLATLRHGFNVSPVTKSKCIRIGHSTIDRRKQKKSYKNVTSVWNNAFYLQSNDESVFLIPSVRHQSNREQESELGSAWQKCCL